MTGPALSRQCYRDAVHGAHTWQPAGWGQTARCEGVADVGPDGLGHGTRATAPAGGVPYLRRPPTPPIITGPLLTDVEKEAVAAAGDLYGLLVRVAEQADPGESLPPAEAERRRDVRLADLAELCAHVHVIQNAVLAQAAARAYPGRYRLLGGAWQRDYADVDAIRAENRQALIDEERRAGEILRGNRTVEADPVLPPPYLGGVLHWRDGWFAPVQPGDMRLPPVDRCPLVGEHVSHRTAVCAARTLEEVPDYAWLRCPGKPAEPARATPFRPVLSTPMRRARRAMPFRRGGGPR